VNAGATYEVISTHQRKMGRFNHAAAYKADSNRIGIVNRVAPYRLLYGPYKIFDHMEKHNIA